MYLASNSMSFADKMMRVHVHPLYTPHGDNRRTGRTTKILLEMVGSIYTQHDTDMFFLTMGEVTSKLNIIQGLFKELGICILSIKEFDSSIIIKTNHAKLVLRSKSAFNSQTYRGIHDRHVYLDHTLYFN